MNTIEIKYLVGNYNQTLKAMLVDWKSIKPLDDIKSVDFKIYHTIEDEIILVSLDEKLVYFYTLEISNLCGKLGWCQCEIIVRGTNIYINNKQKRVRIA